MKNNFSIEICNLRNTKLVNEYDVRVDRASILGNPFHMPNESQRDRVCDLYERYFTVLIRRDTLGFLSLPSEYLPQYKKLGFVDFRIQFMNELYRLYKIAKTYGKLRLFCWCAPKRCHAETIKTFLEFYLNKECK